MTTTAQQTEQSITPQEAAWEAAPYVQIGVPGVSYSAIRIPMSTDPKETAAWIDLALRAAKYLAKQYAEAFPNVPQEAPQRPQQTPQRPQQQRGGGGYGQRETRASKYPVVPGMVCDICNGPVGRYPRTGNMTSDKAVCLGKCKDDRFVHTVAWLDDDGGDPGFDGDLPF